MATYLAQGKWLVNIHTAKNFPVLQKQPDTHSFATQLFLFKLSNTFPRIYGTETHVNIVQINKALS